MDGDGRGWRKKHKADRVQAILINFWGGIGAAMGLRCTVDARPNAVGRLTLSHSPTPYIPLPTTNSPTTPATAFLALAPPLAPGRGGGEEKKGGRGEGEGRS